ncbi:MAG: ABC-F family ATP-binding cassette domain-containing protein [Chloroflexi bacterium]|nr:ABC-F family ATP-binding cassette domain-containing protein [Chloroflexota bacterium]
MNLLTLEAVSKQYSERLLLDKVNLSINSGERIGLIGVNGSGKTTLLRLIAGEEAPDSGNVTLWGHVRVEFLRQEPVLDDSATVLDQLFRSDSPQMQLLAAYESTSQRLERTPHDSGLQRQFLELSAQMGQSGGWAAEANAKAILTRLGIDDFDALVGTLSGGQRKRVALARALIDRADLLILDEPTNHIDAETVDWLEEYLVTTPGALLMVTHDRYFLDRVVNRIVELDRRELVLYPGNYSRYLELREERHEKLAAVEQKRRQFLKRELEWVRRMPMARGTKQKARKDRFAEIERIVYDSGEERVAMALASRRLGTKVLTATGLVKAYDGARVVDGVDFHLEPGDRLGILGPNGAGKSTFLELLAGKLAPDAGTLEWGETVAVGYYDQNADDWEERKRLLEFIEEEASLIRTKEGERVEAAQMLEWFLFPRGMQWGRISSLSGGERRRLYLLRTLIHQPNVLLLDEPTNDLDVQTLSVLEEFLDHFNGCLIVVSHDRYFLDRTVDFILPCENGKLGKRYPAPYESYRRLRDEEMLGEKIASPPPYPPKIGGQGGSATRAANERKKLTWNEQRELEQLEAGIAGWEEEQAALQAAINQGGEEYTRIQALADQLQSVERSLENAFERWAELAERAG